MVTTTLETRPRSPTEGLDVRSVCHPAASTKKKCQVHPWDSLPHFLHPDNGKLWCWCALVPLTLGLLAFICRMRIVFGGPCNSSQLISTHLNWMSDGWDGGVLCNDLTYHLTHSSLIPFTLLECGSGGGCVYPGVTLLCYPLWSTLCGGNEIH